MDRYPHMWLWALLAMLFWSWVVMQLTTWHVLWLSGLTRVNHPLIDHLGLDWMTIGVGSIVALYLVSLLVFFRLLDLDEDSYGL